MNATVTSLPGLTAEHFAHPFDRQAIGALRRLRGFDWAVGKAIEWQYEKRNQVLHTSSSVRVTSQQLPRIHAMVERACAVLDIERPEVYVAAGPVNAETSGHNHPYIVLYSGLVEAMDDTELQAVLGHELGHIKCNHVLYKVMVRWLAEFGIAGVGYRVARRSVRSASTVRLLIKQFTAALTMWDQRSELSADRAAMLAVQDEGACIRMLLKLAGAPTRLTSELNVDAFLDQARRLQDLTFESGAATRHRRRLVEHASHPLVVERARHLDLWTTGGQYDQILADLGAGPVAAGALLAGPVAKGKG